MLFFHFCSERTFFLRQSSLVQRFYQTILAHSSCTRTRILCDFFPKWRPPWNFYGQEISSFQVFHPPLIRDPLELLFAFMSKVLIMYLVHEVGGPYWPLNVIYFVQCMLIVRCAWANTSFYNFFLTILFVLDSASLVIQNGCKAQLFSRSKPVMVRIYVHPSSYGVVVYVCKITVTVIVFFDDKKKKHCCNEPFSFP